jgi:hypothetical protein
MARDGWSINPGGVNNVLSRVQESSESFGSAVTKAVNQTEDLATACGGILGSVVEAAVELMNSNNGKLMAISALVPAAVEGAAAAAEAYRLGDLDMAADAQRDATTAGLPDTRSFPGGTRRAR